MSVLQPVADHTTSPLRSEARISLGTVAKSAATPRNQALTAAGAIRTRWALQRVAQGLLRAERVAGCGRNLAGGAVELWRGKKGSGRASFRGLVTCGSVWHCPVCSEKITRARATEVRRAIEAWIAVGGACYLQTFTVRHDATMPLADTVDAMQDAQRRMKSWRDWKGANKAAGVIGTIRALEVTHGDANGWHPHVHAIVFAAPDQLEALEALRPLWARAVERVGLGRVDEHGYDVRGGDAAAEYVAGIGKDWDAAAELARGPAKAAIRPDRCSPFGLLKAAASGDQEAAALFQEFALVFRGRRQLVWSPGLADRLQVQEPTDDERAALDDLCDDAPIFVCSLHPDDWRIVLSRNARADVLLAVELGGAEGVFRLLAVLGSRPPTHGARFADYDRHPQVRNVYP